MRPTAFDLVENGMACIGCGVCAAVCPENALSVAVQADGSLRVCAVDNSSCEFRCGACVAVCPFGPAAMTVQPATLEPRDSRRMDPHVGAYVECYVGAVASEADRVAAASGGLASLLTAQLLAGKHVEQVFTVKPAGAANGSDALFEYARFTSAAGITESSRGSAYYQLSVEDALRAAAESTGRSAFTALPCVAQAIRAAERRLGLIGERKPIIIGLACGQVKTRLFADYVAKSAGVTEPPTAVKFRVSKPGHAANDYGLHVTGRSSQGETRWSVFSDVWVSGAFTPSACWECGDVFATASDVCLMDAWLPEYMEDWRGTNLAVVRSEFINGMLSSAGLDGLLALEPIEVGRVVASQSGVVQRKTQGTQYRLGLARRIDASPSLLNAIPPGVADRWRYRTMWEISRRSPGIWLDSLDTRRFKRWLQRRWALVSLTQRIANRVYRALHRFGR